MVDPSNPVHASQSLSVTWLITIGNLVTSQSIMNGWYRVQPTKAPKHHVPVMPIAPASRGFVPGGKQMAKEIDFDFDFDDLETEA